MKGTMAIALSLVLIYNAVLVVGQKSSSNSAERKATSERKPDLVPILHNPMDGEIRVKNIGGGPAAPSKLTLDCVRLDALSQMYSCPNLPLSDAPTYFDPAFPNNATIKIPALAPGATFTHKLSFWDVSTWPKGRYKFTVVVDAAHTLAESNTVNNVGTSRVTVP